MANDFLPTSFSLAETEAFCAWRAVDDIDHFEHRHQVQLPDWFVPSAHGCAVASSHLMQRVGYNAAQFQRRGWVARKRLKGFEKRLRDHRYLVRQCGNYFSVERSLQNVSTYSGVLTTRTGSIPIVTRTADEAMFLAQLEDLPHFLRWVELCPNVDRDTMYERVKVLSL